MLPTRRAFLLRAAALGAAYAASPVRVIARAFERDPFALGVASGYPHPGGMTLWTRLAPRPLEGGGMRPAAVEVRWEVASDEAFRTIAANGRTTAAAEWAHSVHVDVKGLEPGRPYWYRFHAGEATSPVGRTSTAPAAEAAPSRLRLAFASCQQYEQGWFTAYRHMAREDLDLVVHLGDYIYESSWGRNLVRSHGSDQPYTLAEYRTRHALYKLDDDLRAAHAAFPWIVTWDDHEVQNDYANDRSQVLDSPEAFLARRAAAYQAYYEHMPLPAWARPRGPAMRLHTALDYGRLASFYVLDDRQYRSHQACPPEGRGGSTVVKEEDCRQRLDRSLTMLGSAQEQWLDESFGRSRAAWNIVAQQTLMAQADRRAGPGGDFWTDGWDGYPRARERLLAAVAQRALRNPLVISGDVHMSAVCDLKANFDDARSPVVATEICGPSITSQGPSVARVEALLKENPHFRFANGARRGYATLDITPARCVARLRTVGTVKEPDAPIHTLATFAVEDGRPGAHRA
ncbi:MAG TPA: alkaline phosphatase D family protein [Burkholderiales bacterium]|nr:alkaline phosphatase D family protein [Burkholderiales bacterium]